MAVVLLRTWIQDIVWQSSTDSMEEKYPVNLGMKVNPGARNEQSLKYIREKRLPSDLSSKGFERG